MEIVADDRNFIEFLVLDEKIDKLSAEYKKLAEKREEITADLLKYTPAVVRWRGNVFLLDEVRDQKGRRYIKIVPIRRAVLEGPYS